MNRAERRKRERAGISVKKEPTLNLKVSAFNTMVSTATKQAKDRATAAAIHEIDQQILERNKAFSGHFTLTTAGERNDLRTFTEQCYLNICVCGSITR